MMEYLVMKDTNPFWMIMLKSLNPLKRNPNLLKENQVMMKIDIMTMKEKGQILFSI